MRIGYLNPWHFKSIFKYRMFCLLSLQFTPCKQIKQIKKVAVFNTSVNTGLVNNYIWKNVNFPFFHSISPTNENKISNWKKLLLSNIKTLNILCEWAKMAKVHLRFLCLFNPSLLWFYFIFLFLFFFATHQQQNGRFVKILLCLCSNNRGKKVFFVPQGQCVRQQV